MDDARAAALQNVSVILGSPVTIDTSNPEANQASPKIGDQKLVSAQAGFQSWTLGSAGQAVSDQAALHEFVSSADGTLSPISFLSGIPNPTEVEGALDTLKIPVDAIVGTSNPDITTAAANLFSQALVALNKEPPFMGVTTVQTATYVQPTTLFGLVNWGDPKWVNNDPVNTSVTNGPLPGGFYATSSAAAQAAAAALQQQLANLGYPPPPN